MSRNSVRGPRSLTQVFAVDHGSNSERAQTVIAPSPIASGVKNRTVLSSGQGQWTKTPLSFQYGRCHLTVVRETRWRRLQCHSLGKAPCLGTHAIRYPPDCQVRATDIRTQA